MKFKGFVVACLFTLFSPVFAANQNVHSDANNDTQMVQSAKDSKLTNAAKKLLIGYIHQLILQVYYYLNVNYDYIHCYYYNN